VIELLEFSSERGMLIDPKSIVMVQPRKRWSLVTLFTGEKIKVLESVVEIQSEIDEAETSNMNLGAIMDQMRGEQ
jgi:hypothetical protein